MTIPLITSIPNRSQDQTTFDTNMAGFVTQVAATIPEMNNTAAAMNLNSTTDTSATSNSIGTGAKTFTVSAGKSFIGGMWLVIADTAAPSTNSMTGQITSYSGTTLVMNITGIMGSGTKTAWTISQSASGNFASLTGATFTGLVNLATGANIASATTLNLSTATGNTVHITGTTATSAVTMNAGQWMECIADGAWPLTYHATNNNINGGASVTLAAGDRVFYFYDGTTVYGNIIKQDGSSVGTSFSKLTSITAAINTPTAGKFTWTLLPCVLDFRNSSVTNGVPNTRQIQSTLSLATDNNGASFGAITAVQARLLLLAIDSGAGIVLGVTNSSGGINLTEEGVLTSTTAITGAVTSATTVYTTSALGAGLYPYRIVGAIDATWTTGSGWVTTPAAIIGAGGNALTAMSSAGFGQTWQAITLAASTTYYNTSGKQITICIQLISVGAGACTLPITIGGYAMNMINYPANGASWNMEFSFDVPANQTYSLGALTNATIVASSVKK